MALILHYHPLSSFCHKVLIALYENDTPFTPKVVNLQDESERAAFHKLWPVGKFPVLENTDTGWNVPESSIIIEYLDQYFPGRTRFIPADPELARQMRFRDRFFDLHIHMHMQKIVGDRLRPADKKDPHGVEGARSRMTTALDMVDQAMAEKRWANGDDFTMADCAAAPALFYADKVMPFAASHPRAYAYLERLRQRPSYARTLKEAEPFMQSFPKG